MSDLPPQIETKIDVKWLKGHPDNFNGIVVYSKEINNGIQKSEQDFEDALLFSVDHWKETNIRGVWFKIEIAHSNLIPILAKHKFVFHHAQPSYVMMTRWLPDNQPNLLPGYASNYIGVGGFVLNDNNELLVIQEKFPGLTRKAVWKLPGGHADVGEDLAATAIREVLEETGVETEFVSVVCFRHLHNYRFGQSDIYFVCHLRPITQEIKACPFEIDKCEWMDLDKFVANSSAVSPFNQCIVECFRDSQSSKSNVQPQMVNTYGSHKNLVYSVHSTHRNGLNK